MKLSLYTLMVFCAFGLLSCRKSSLDITIKQFDDQQIQAYMAQNGLTAVMNRDKSGGDTTGIYYQILSPGTGDTIKYSDKISFVYSVKSFDGTYANTDTILNHTHAYTAYVGPIGFQLSLINILKHRGGKMRVLIPSHLAYRVNGTSFTTVLNNTGVTATSYITGNQCLDYTVTLVDDKVVTIGSNLVNKQGYYDDYSIKNYLAANNLTQYYTKLPGGTYYRIIQAGTGTSAISPSTVVGIQYTGSLFNGTIFDQQVTTDGSTAVSDPLLVFIPAWQQVFPLVTAGAQLSIICPSSQAYGSDLNAQANAYPIPGFSCLRFEITVVSVQN